MKLIVHQALMQLLDDEIKWDKWLGSFLTQPKRLRISYPVPLYPTSCDSDPHIQEKNGEWIKSLGVWGDPKQAVDVVLHSGHGALYQTEGITFAYSHHHRLFVDGDVWDVDESVPVQIIASSRRIDRDTFSGLKVSNETVRLLEDLVERGLLYGSDE